MGEGNIVQAIRKRIDDIFSPKEMASRLLILDQIVRERLKALKPSFSHRDIRIIEDITPTEAIKIPMEPLQKVIDGLVKNAVENTPDEGKIEIRVKQTNGLVEMTVKDLRRGHHRGCPEKNL